MSILKRSRIYEVGQERYKLHQCGVGALHGLELCQIWIPVLVHCNLSRSAVAGEEKEEIILALICEDPAKDKSKLSFLTCVTKIT